MSSKILVRGAVFVLHVAALVVGCGSSSDPSAEGASGADGGAGAVGEDDSWSFGGDGSKPELPRGDGGPSVCVPVTLADGTTPQCADCIDNDGDGRADGADPECAGPLDNDEATFGTGIAGDNVDACKQDCFFDGNSGQGDDGCEWNFKCDAANPGAARCPYDPNFKNCPAKQSDRCIQFCSKLAPNGCDCFGCCNIPLSDGGSVNVTLSSTCSLADIGDSAKCSRCTPSADCTNTCERCELCIGKTSLPADCAGSTADGGTGQTCSTGAVCNATTACPSSSYCVTGCCVPILR